MTGYNILYLYPFTLGIFPTVLSGIWLYFSNVEQTNLKVIFQVIFSFDLRTGFVYFPYTISNSFSQRNSMFE